MPKSKNRPGHKAKSLKRGNFLRIEKKRYQKMMAALKERYINEMKEKHKTTEEMLKEKINDLNIGTIVENNVTEEE